MANNKHIKSDAIIPILTKVGLANPSKIADTLQGSIWRAFLKSTPTKSMVVKVTNKYLQEYSLAKEGTKTVTVQENILWESKILKYLTKCKDCPKSIVKFNQIFRTNSDYYLVMQDGGMSLFKFVQQVHQLIALGQIDIAHWIKACKIIFKQMIEVIEYIHSKNVCHFDISLENFLINHFNIKIQKNANGKQRKVIFNLTDIQIKLCDFGLAEWYITNECKSNKYCGKEYYKSPEIINKKKIFDAKKNDIWCVGVTLFMLICGGTPWNIAHENDESYKYMVGGFMKGMLKQWDLLKFVDDNLLDLFEKIFVDEDKRINLKQIKIHQWITKK